MKIVNQTPFPVHAMPGTGPGDEPVLTIVLKGTFELMPGQCARPATEVMPIAFGDELVETPRGMLPLWDSDLAPFKPRADVLLVGMAHAPRGKPCRELDVRMQVGRVDKTLRVFGERRWERGLLGGDPRPGEPEPFREAEISSAYAYGGGDTKRGAVFLENPIGIGFIADKAKHRDVEGQELPRVEDPAHLVARWKDRPSPARFGSLGRGWASRVRHLGTYDERWEQERAPLPPRDFSYEFFNAAPRDQQVKDYLEGNEPFRLDHATPSGPLIGKLPGVRPGVGVRHACGTSVRPVELRLDTLVLIPERMIMLLVWRGLCPIPSAEDPHIDEITVDLEGS
jgi:hypothetical protein